MDKSGGLQGVIGTLAAQLILCHGPELSIDERQQLIERRRIAVIPRNQHLSRAFWRNHGICKAVPIKNFVVVIRFADKWCVYVIREKSNATSQGIRI